MESNYMTKEEFLKYWKFQDSLPYYEVTDITRIPKTILFLFEKIENLEKENKELKQLLKVRHIL